MRRVGKAIDLVMGPCSNRPTPLAELIGEPEVRADPNDKRSPNDKLAEISISGSHSSPVRFRSLHWGIPSQGDVGICSVLSSSRYRTRYG